MAYTRSMITIKLWGFASKTLSDLTLFAKHARAPNHLDNELCEFLGCQLLGECRIVHCCYECIKFGCPYCDEDCAVRQHICQEL